MAKANWTSITAVPLPGKQFLISSWSNLLTLNSKPSDHLPRWSLSWVCLAELAHLCEAFIDVTVSWFHACQPHFINRMQGKVLYRDNFSFTLWTLIFFLVVVFTLGSVPSSRLKKYVSSVIWLMNNNSLSKNHIGAKTNCVTFKSMMEFWNMTLPK